MRTARIIVVEDEPIVAMDIEESLVQKGFTVSGIVPTVTKALKMRSQEASDLILLDMDTKDAAPALPWVGVPMVLLTSSAASNPASLLPLAGRCTCAVVTKPFLESRLVEAVVCVLDHQPSRLTQRGRGIAVSAERTGVQIEEITGGRNGISTNPTIPGDQRASLVAS